MKPRHRTGELAVDCNEDMPILAAPRLERPDERLPKLGVIITHHNYSDLVERAIRSVLDQSHPDIDCIIVDDGSRPDEASKLEAIVNHIDDPRLRLVLSPENEGQIPAFFRGLNECAADFISLLDPDDLLAFTFAEEMLQAHLNPHVIAPVASCNQGYYRIRGGSLSGGNNRVLFSEQEEAPVVELAQQDRAPLRYYRPDVTGWLWRSTSSNVMRRDAVELVRPHRPLAYQTKADAYMVPVLHMMGGSLDVPSTLVHRGVHPQSTYKPDRVISYFQRSAGRNKTGGNFTSNFCRLDAIDAFFVNGGHNYFDAEKIAAIIHCHLSAADIVRLCENSPEAKAILMKG